MATETYVQADVTGLARIFTGLTMAAGVKPDRYRLPLVMNASINETNGSGSLSGDHAYAHAGLYTVTITLKNTENQLTLPIHAR